MSLATGEFVGLMAIFFIIALLYSSVGFGGGSSYLAILALVLTSFFVIRSTALLCNLAVVSGSCYLYFQRGHLQLKKFLPFVVTSVPMAFLGASFRLKENVFFIILGISLIASAIALAMQTIQLKTDFEPKRYPSYLLYLLGGGIGLLSGLVGIGGGIFLAPVLNYLKWDRPLVIAALASFFILVNSVSGLTGLALAGTFEWFWPEIGILLAVVIIGGQIGVRLSLGQFSAKTIRLITALLVFVVGVRVLLDNGWQLNVFR
ncbi:sulfite exporter TauE/SafE family protein [Allomuricauda sp. SCSIO 65647]|uniref:sulfite exporter TauE/SafE family protein n=1 Tax=Allomuricauda sp. SCSIO 65647 TaxID=2908843 RepID=UPI001F2F2667|nr:sulfite exporter TauE/SafE family protein [Muricauda sp. SCSIO 65647]UJH67311.1 sulfite exporter TauE/SafE family protein [Muricauda sp. SCSIO 65647]